MKTQVQKDEITEVISNAFDFEFDGTTEFVPPTISPIDRETYIDTPEGFGIGLLVGPSGSGKSTILRQFGEEEVPVWDGNKAIASHFNDADDAIDRLSAVGFNSIPSWLRPFHVCSNGEQFRASLARKLKDNAVIDEFTSVIDRAVAKSCSMATRKYVDKQGLKGIVFASCHYDIIEWLQPDWVFDTKTGVVTPRGSLRQRPEIVLEMLPTSTKIWSSFCDHHYLTADINKGSRCWAVEWNGQLVGFNSIIPMPSGVVRKAWREHRLVVLPDFQGMGLGTKISEATGEMIHSWGGRFYSKSAHPRLGAYRDKSAKWRETSRNKKDMGGEYQQVLDSMHHPMPRKGKIMTEAYKKNLEIHMHRICFSHEYIGENPENKPHIPL